MNALEADGRWNAEVRIFRLFARDKPHVEVMTCLKVTPDVAEHSGEISAKRCVELNAPEDQQ